LKVYLKMIVFNKIKEYSSLDDILNMDNSYLIYGKYVDDRGKEIVSYLTNIYTSNIQIEYKNTIDSFLLNSDKVVKRLEIVKMFEDIAKSFDYIIIESTTLGYCDILLMLFTINMLKNKIKIKVYYAEPIKYKSNKDNNDSDIYELSEEYSNHKYIKPFILPNPHDSTSDEQATLITLIGFEENRMGRVLNDSENKYDHLVSVFPIPGFKFGWENISLSKHYYFLEKKEDIYYAPADNPYETFKMLNKIVLNIPNKRVIILPIGTKPSSIGVTIFLINEKERNKASRIATKYDFPIKKSGRSIGIDKIYEYELFLRYE